MMGGCPCWGRCWVDRDSGRVQHEGVKKIAVAVEHVRPCLVQDHARESDRRCRSKYLFPSEVFAYNKMAGLRRCMCATQSRGGQASGLAVRR